MKDYNEHNATLSDTFVVLFKSKKAVLQHHLCHEIRSTIFKKVASDVIWDHRCVILVELLNM